MVATWSLLGSRVLIAVLLFALGTGGDGEVAELARAAAEHLAARIREVAANVTHARVLQAALDGEVYGAQARSFSVNASLLRRQARLAEEGLVAAAAPSLLSLRDAAAKAQARAAEMYPPAQQQEPASQSGPVADDLGEAMRAQGVDADRLREAGVLREAALDADVKALDHGKQRSDDAAVLPASRHSRLWVGVLGRVPPGRRRARRPGRSGAPG